MPVGAIIISIINIEEVTVTIFFIIAAVYAFGIVCEVLNFMWDVKDRKEQYNYHMQAMMNSGKGAPILPKVLIKPREVLTSAASALFPPLPIGAFTFRALGRI